MSEDLQTKLFSVVGRAVLEEAKANPTFRGQLRRALDQRIRSEAERKIAGLAELLGDGDHADTGD